MNNSKAKNALNMVFTVLFSVLAVLYVYPVFMILINSFKVETAINTSTVFQLPTANTFAGTANFVAAVVSQGFLQSFFYSLFIPVSSVALILLCCSMSVSYTHLDVYKRQAQTLGVQPQGDPKPAEQLQGHVHHRPEQCGKQRPQKTGIELEQSPHIIGQTDHPEIRPVIQVHVGQRDIGGVPDGEHHHDQDEKNCRSTVQPRLFAHNATTFLPHKRGRQICRPRAGFGF